MMFDTGGKATAQPMREIGGVIARCGSYFEDITEVLVSDGRAAAAPARALAETERGLRSGVADLRRRLYAEGFIGRLTTFSGLLDGAARAALLERLIDDLQALARRRDVNSTLLSEAGWQRVLRLRRHILLQFEHVRALVEGRADSPPADDVERRSERDRLECDAWVESLIEEADRAPGPASCRVAVYVTALADVLTTLRRLVDAGPTELRARAGQAPPRSM